MSQSGSKAKKYANAHFKFVVLLIYMYCFNFCLSRCHHHHRHCLSSLLLWSRDFATMVTWLLHFSSLLRVLRFFFWAACVTEWKISFVIYSPGLKFTIKLLYYHLGQISMYRIIDTCIMNVKRFWVPLLQLLVNSFCLFIYYYYIIIIIIIIIIVVIIVIVIIIIISCIFFCRKHKQTSGRGKISVPRY